MRADFHSPTTEEGLADETHTKGRESASRPGRHVDENRPAQNHLDSRHASAADERHDKAFEHAVAAQPGHARKRSRKTRLVGRNAELEGRSAMTKAS
jgi:hypothetical protein